MEGRSSSVYSRGGKETSIDSQALMVLDSIVRNQQTPCDAVNGDYYQGVHYAVIRTMCKIGDYCTLLNQSTIEGVVRVGDGVRIMSHVYIPSRTWIGDNVFIGPGVTFLNDRYPCRYESMPTPRGATIEDDVMIGGGGTVLPGVTIGERCFIPTGAGVSRDVPPHSFVVRLRQ